MIYKFRMISADDKAFLRDYEIDSCVSFLELHTFFQDKLGYEPGQLASFFIADEHWNKGLELTVLDMENDAGPAAIPMESVKIGDLLKVKRDRLLYVFDIFSDRALFIELMDIYPQKEGVRYPLCSACIGDAPLQFDNSMVGTHEEVDDSIREIFDDFESDEYGSEGYDGDEK